MLDLQETLRRYASLIEDLLEKEIPKGREDFLSEGVWYQFDSGGKRLRPALCLMSCEALEGNPASALPFALATEILHNFLLIHDDIEDGDTMRRDQQTLWAKEGIPNALNVADYLIAKAYRLILGASLPDETKVRLAQAYTLAFERTVEGQALDINLRGDPEVTLETYFRIVQLKTAYYLALTWVGGGIVAGVRDEDLGPFWDLGKCLGPAFQIRDDLIDLTEGKGRGGEIGCDLREGKPSIFFAYVLDRKVGSEEERRRLIDTVRCARDETTSEDIAWAIEFFRKHGALDHAQREAQRLVGEAEGVLDRLPLGKQGAKRFRSVARFIIDRKF